MQLSIKRLKKGSGKLVKAIKKKLKRKRRRKKEGKIERQIRKRIEELYKIKDSYEDEEDKDVIDGVISEFYGVLGEEEPKPKSNRAYEKEIRELEEKNQKLQTTINILRGNE